MSRSDEVIKFVTSYIEGKALTNKDKNLAFLNYLSNCISSDPKVQDEIYFLYSICLGYNSETDSKLVGFVKRIVFIWKNTIDKTDKRDRFTHLVLGLKDTEDPIMLTLILTNMIMILYNVNLEAVHYLNSVFKNQQLSYNTGIVTSLNLDSNTYINHMGLPNDLQYLKEVFDEVIVKISYVRYKNDFSEISRIISDESLDSTTLTHVKCFKNKPTIQLYKKVYPILSGQDEETEDLPLIIPSSEKTETTVKPSIEIQQTDPPQTFLMATDTHVSNTSSIVSYIECPILIQKLGQIPQKSLTDFFNMLYIECTYKADPLIDIKSWEDVDRQITVPLLQSLCEKFSTQYPELMDIKTDITGKDQINSLEKKINELLEMKSNMKDNIDEMTQLIFTLKSHLAAIESKPAITRSIAAAQERPETVTKTSASAKQQTNPELEKLRNALGW